VDLYTLDADPAAFRRLCGGNQQEEDQETCVEIAPLAGADDAYALRDSKNPAAGTLRFTGAELRVAGMSVRRPHRGPASGATPCPAGCRASSPIRLPGCTPGFADMRRYRPCPHTRPADPHSGGTVAASRRRRRRQAIAQRCHCRRGSRP